MIHHWTDRHLFVETPGGDGNNISRNSWGWYGGWETRSLIFIDYGDIGTRQARLKSGSKIPCLDSLSTFNQMPHELPHCKVTL